MKTTNKRKLTSTPPPTEKKKITKKTSKVDSFIHSKKKIAFITKKLNELYPSPPIPLKHNNTFELLIAVLLSAQSTDKTVNRVTPALFSLANTPKKMAKKSTEEIYNIVKPCGLGYRKAPAIQKLSEILANEHDSEVPSTLELLEALPGVGHKTASVVVSQAFGIPALAVDTHVHRLAARWGLSDGKNVTRTERHLKAAFPKKKWSKVHLQIIYFGREYCPAKKHNSDTCPICKRIPAFDMKL